MWAKAKHELRRVLKPLVMRARPRRVDLPLSTWGLSREGGALCLRGVDLESLVRKYGSPLHVVDTLQLARNAIDFLAETRCETYYSYKTNPVRGVLERLHRVGIGAEVISPYELWLARELGVPAERIVYNGPAKTEDSLKDAIRSGVGLVNVNCREEIAVLAKTARDLKRRVRTGIRVVVPGGWGGQFGEPIDTGAAMRAFREAITCPELEVVALHAHLGSEISTREGLASFVDRVLDFCEELRSTLGIELSILDFGGSLACRTVSKIGALDLRLNRAFGCDIVPRAPESVLSIREYANTIADEVEAHYAERGLPRPRVFLEPGRAMTGNTQLLLSTVLSVREPQGEVAYAVLDAGINIAEPVRNEFHQLFCVGAKNGERRAYRLAGPICTPMDVLYSHAELPAIDPGDVLAICDAGAYFVPFSTSFSFPQPAIIAIEDGSTQLLRRAERFQDLARLDLAP